MKRKQDEFLQEGSSWQFATVGIEVNPTAQRAAYKVHALQELLEPLAEPAAKEYEDHIADILTDGIMQSNFPILKSLFGPVRFSVRWQDFVEGKANPMQHAWVEQVLRDTLSDDPEPIDDILLEIVAAESKTTPGTILQLLKKNSPKRIGSTPESVADAHVHNHKVEFYLPLEGPGQVKVQYQAEGTVYTYMPDPNAVANLDLAKLGATMVDVDGVSIPAVVYQGKTYPAEGRMVSVPVGENRFVQFFLIRPGDIHDFVNVGISPASAYALTLGFPREEGLSLEGDFQPRQFNVAR